MVNTLANLYIVSLADQAPTYSDITRIIVAGATSAEEAKRLSANLLQDTDARVYWRANCIAESLGTPITDTDIRHSGAQSILLDIFTPAADLIYKANLSVNPLVDLVPVVAGIDLTDVCTSGFTVGDKFNVDLTATNVHQTTPVTCIVTHVTGGKIDAFDVISLGAFESTTANEITSLAAIPAYSVITGSGIFSGTTVAVTWAFSYNPQMILLSKLQKNLATISAFSTARLLNIPNAGLAAATAYPKLSLATSGKGDYTFLIRTIFPELGHGEMKSLFTDFQQNGSSSDALVFGMKVSDRVDYEPISAKLL